MREIVFPLISLGSPAEEMPDAADVAEWISKIKGNTADIITYNLQSSLSAQKPHAAETCAGGIFYTPRIKEVLGFEDKVTQDFLLDAEPIRDDLRAVKIKHSGFALPAFSNLNLTDAYYKDSEEFFAAGADAYKFISRELRDNGACRVVLHADFPDDLELEVLRGKKYLWSVPDSELERVLEMSRDIVVDFKSASRLDELLDCYQIRYVYIRDADSEALKTALKFFDKEYIFTAGYGDGSEYWKNLSGLKIKTEE